MSADRRASYRQLADNQNISSKANRILNIILIAMLLIVLRIWHLSVVQYDEKLEESRKPQRRNVSEPAKRATIRDRFNIPLAINKVQYNISILYSQIKQIPTTSWETDEDGNKIKHYKRKEYVTSLSQLLAKELQLDADRVEDLIYAKASLYNQYPYVLKEGVSEREFYRLKMLEKDWPGINVQRVSKRHYPKGKTAGDIIGYMGAINSQEYEKIISEIKALNEYLQGTDSGEILNFPEGMHSTEQVKKRLKDLHELSYSVNDSIGKTGIEGRFETALRGFRGKKSYYSDARGNFLRELPGTRDPVAGKRLLLTISAELQEYVEELLIKNEKIRQTRLSRLDAIKHTILAEKDPWIKGGAIIAMEPNTGEILAMASHPRLDPNDFISAGNNEDSKKKWANINKWLENETFLADLWNQQHPMSREAFSPATKGIYLEELPITWEHYLDLVLPKNSPLKKLILSHSTIQEAIEIQLYVEKLLEFAPQYNAYAILNVAYKGEGHESHGKKLTAHEINEVEEELESFSEELKKVKNALKNTVGTLNHTYDQVLLADLMRLIVPADKFSNELIHSVGQQSLSDYKNICSAMVKVNDAVKKMTKELFHELDFKEWRKSNEKEFLKKKREEEKNSHRYAKPYIDYLDTKENELFQLFWHTHQWHFLSVFLKDFSCESFAACEEHLVPYYENFHNWHKEISQGAHQEIDWAKDYHTLKNSLSSLNYPLTIEYLKTLRSYQELNRPLLGKYRYLRKNENQSQQEKHLAAAFYPRFGYSYGRSQGYRQATTQGSIFKLITSYEALVQRYNELEDLGLDTNDLNPLEMVDHISYKGKDLYLGSNQNGQPLPRFYKGGRLPRSAISNIGKVDILKALELSSNPYFAILAGDVLSSPTDLLKAAKMFSFGSKTGIDLPGEIAGSMPKDLETNRTGLYSLSIGQHTLVVTPLQTSVMLSTLANGGEVLKPQIIEMMVGREPKRGRELVSGNQHFPYQAPLSLLNIDFPLFVAADAEKQKSLIKRIPTEVKRMVFLPDPVRRMLLDGMCRVVARTHGESIKGLLKMYGIDPQAIQDYVEFKYQLLGKTSTSESIENIDLDLEVGTNLYTHVWFGGIVYEQDVVDKKEIRFLFRDSFGKPELVIVVYLRYGGFGKEGGPIAAQVAKKWREIKKARGL